MQSPLRAAAHNMGLLLLIALPLGVVALMLQTAIVPPTWMRRDGTQIEMVPAALFEFLTLLLPVLAGGFVHQLLLWVIPDTRVRVTQRVLILLTSLVIPVVLMLFGSSASLVGSARAWIPLGIVVVAYGLMARPLPRLRG